MTIGNTARTTGKGTTYDVPAGTSRKFAKRFRAQIFELPPLHLPPSSLSYFSPLFVRRHNFSAPLRLFARSLGPQWAGFVSLAGAVVLPVEAWANITELVAFDAGNSKTNSLYWIATRPQGGT